ncbi:MAG: AI-2E family transporter [Verrucomicrobiota bacterium]
MIESTSKKSARISYGIMAILLIVVGWFHVGTLVLAAMFGYFALEKFSFGRSKTLAVILYLIAVISIGYGLFHFSRLAYDALPKIAADTIPAVVGYAERTGLELPFTDYASLKAVAMNEFKEQFGQIGRYAGVAFVQLAMLIIGLVIALSLFLNSRWEVDDDPEAIKNNLYSTVVGELILRFRNFYHSFGMVIGAQIIISIFNTVFTCIFLLWNGFPYVLVIMVLTFLCGLLPIVGNILSNTLIIGVGFTISPKVALMALIFLIVIHKLEYFLNSKIIGDRIKNPMWLTLIGIVLGEKLMGIPGMILAPVVLHYIKLEASRNKFSDTTGPQLQSLENK